jgi:hypothetical protein
MLNPTNPFNTTHPVVGDAPISARLDVPLQYYSNKYDEYYRQGYNQVWNRSSNQSWGEQLGYGLISRTLSIIPKLGAGFSSVSGALGKAVGGGNPADIWDNPVNDWFNNIDESLKEIFPVYSSRANDQATGMLGKMATTSFWANEGFDAFAYAASAYVPGAIIGKTLAAAGTAIKATQIGGNIARGLRAVGIAGEVGQGTHRANILLSTAYNTISESAAEAYQTQKELEAIYQEQGKTADEAKKLASEGAARVYRANLIALAGPDLVQNMLFHGSWNSLQKGVREAVWNLKEVEKVSSIWKKIGGSIASEGFWEENIQNSLQTWEKNAAWSGNNGDERFKEITMGMVNNIGSFFSSFIPGKVQSSEEIDAATSIFLGGLIGTGAAVRSHIQEKKTLASVEKTERERYDAVKEYVKTATGLFADSRKSILKTKGKKIISQDGANIEIDDFELDEQGKPILDQEAIHRITLNTLRNKNLWDAQMVAASENDFASNELNKQASLASFVVGLMHNKYAYTADEVSKYLDRASDLGVAQAKAEGFETEIKANMAMAKEYAKQFESIRTKHSSLAKDAKSTPEDAAFADFMVKTELYLNVKQKALENIQQTATTTKAKETVAKLLEDNTEYLRQIREEQSAIRKEYKTTVFDREAKKGQLDKAIKDKDHATALKLSYNLTENEFINGTWSNANNSRTLPSQNHAIAANVQPGSIDYYNYHLGNSMIAHDRVTKALANNEDIVDIADEFLKIDVVTPEDKAIVLANKDTIKNQLEAEEDRTHEEGADIQKILYGLNTADYDGELMRELVEMGIAEQSASDFIDHMNLNAKTPIAHDAILGDVVQTQEWKDFIAEAGEKFDTAGERVATIQLKRVEIDNFETENKRMDDFVKAANKEDFLKDEFYDQHVRKGVKNFIARFQKAPTDLMDEQLYKRNKIRLEEAVEGSDNPVIVAEAKANLDYFQKVIYPQIVHNIMNRVEIHKAINNQITLAMLEGLPIDDLIAVVTPDQVNTLSNVTKTVPKDNTTEIEIEEAEVLVDIDKLTKDLTVPYPPDVALQIDELKTKSQARVATLKAETITVTEAVSTSPDLAKLIDRLKDLEYGGVVSFDAVISMLGSVRDSSPETLARVQDAIQKHLDKQVNEFIDFVSPLVTDDNLLGLLTKQKTNGDFQNRIYWPIQYFINAYFSQKGELPSEIVRFNADLDVALLYKSLTDSSEITDDDKEVLRRVALLYFQLIGNNVSTTLLNSNLSTERLLEFKQAFSTIPSLQQNIALTQIAIFLSAPKTAKGSGLWMLSKGIGGSGKSYFLGHQVKLLSDILLGAPTKYMAFSKDKGTSDNINKAINPDKPQNHTFESFNKLTDDELAALDFIVIDEVFTFTDKEITKIQARTDKAKVKVIALGDASQITAEAAPFLLREPSINMTIPLTTSYRTNISSVAAFLDRFRLKSDEVTDAVATFNMPLEDLVENPAKGYGVISVPIDALELLISQPSSRSRVLIVSNQAMKDIFTQKYPTLDVRLPKDAQGIQWDEVYSLVTPAAGKSAFENNRTLYTTYSRAKSMLVIVNEDVSNEPPLDEMNLEVANSDTELSKIADMFHENIQAVKDLQKVQKGIPFFTSEETSETEELGVHEPQTELYISNAMGETIVIEEPDSMDNASGFELFEPTNYGLNSANEWQSPRLDKGSPIYFIKTRNKEGNVVIKVIGKNKHRTSNNGLSSYYFEIAILSEKDWSRPETKLFFEKINNSTEEISSTEISKIDTRIEHNVIESIAAGRATLSDFAKFKTITDGKFVAEHNLINGANDIIEDAIIKAYTSYYGDKILDPSKVPDPWVTISGPEGAEKYTVNWAAIPDKAIDMIIPTHKYRKDGPSWRNETYNARDINIFYGLPHLAIRFEKNGKSTPFLIRMQPKALSKTDPLVATIQELRAAVKTIETLTPLILGTEKFAEFITKYKEANYTIEMEADRGVMTLIDSPSPITEYPPSNELVDAVRKVVELVYGPKLSEKYWRTQEAAEKELKDNGTEAKNGVGTIYKGARILSVIAITPTKWVFNQATDAGDTTKTRVYREWSVAEGRGPAQHALNTIAKANNKVGDSKIRQTQTKGEGANLTKLTRTPSILLSAPYTDYEGLLDDPRLIGLLTEKEEDYFNKLATSSVEEQDKKGTFTKLVDTLTDAVKKADNKTESAARAEVMTWVKAYTAEKITSDLLDKLVGDDAFDPNTQRHRSLRTPLHLYNKTTNDGINDLGADLHGEANQVNRNKLSAQLQHDFVKFQRTRIFFESPEVKVTKPGGQTKPDVTKSSSLKKVLGSIKKTGNPIYDDMVTLLKLWDVDCSIIEHQKGIVVDENGQKVTKKFASTIYSDGVTSVKAQGFSFDNINKDSNVLHIFLHEGLHVATKAAMIKGRKDVKDGNPNTKEALLYTRMRDIKKRFNSGLKTQINPKTGKKYTSPKEIYEKTSSKLDVDEFVANLANPEFVAVAKSILLTPAGKRDSLLRRLLNAIVDFFKDKLGDNPTVYDAAKATLEEFYSVSPDTKMPEVVQPQVIYNVADLLKEVTSQLEAASEYTFDTTLAKLRNMYQGIIDEESYPDEKGDDFELATTSDFKKKSPELQSLMIGQTKGTSSEAWFNVESDRVEFKPGVIQSSLGLDLMLNKLTEKEGFTKYQTNLLTSLVRKEILGERVIDALVIPTTMDRLLDVYYEKIFSGSDKQKFILNLGVQTDEQAKNAILDMPDMMISLMGIQRFVQNNKKELKRIVKGSQDLSSSRYRNAKRFVEKLIKANLDLDNQFDSPENPLALIKTMPYVRLEIEELMKSEDPILLSGKSLSQLQNELTEAYAELDNLRKNLKDSTKQSTLLYSIIPKLEAELSGILALKQKDYTTNKSMLDLILNDIYPNADFSTVDVYADELQKLAELDYVPKSEIATELLEIADISDYLNEYNRSYENTLSESLRNSFRKITLGDTVISPGLAYIKTMQLVMSLDWNIHTNDGVDSKQRPIGLNYIRMQLEENWQQASSELTKAIIENLLDTIRYATTSNFRGVDVWQKGDPATNPEARTFGIVMFKGDDKTIEYRAYSVNNSAERGVIDVDATTLTHQDILNRMDQGEDILLSETPPTALLSKDTTTLFKWLNSKTTITPKQFNRMFMKAEAANTIRAIFNTMASMKETELYTANRSSSKGLELKFQRAVASGVNIKFKDQLIANLTTMYEQGTLGIIKTKFANFEYNNIRASELKKQDFGRLLYIKAFFQFLGIPSNDIEVPTSSRAEVVRDIDGFLGRTTEIKDYSFEEEQTGADDTQFDIFKWLDSGVDGYLTRFSRILGASDKLVRNQSVRDAHGNPFYLNHESSHLYDTLLNLAELSKGNPVFHGGTGTDVRRVVPAYLKNVIDPNNPDSFLPSYYDHNIFVRGKIMNSLYSVIEIDGSRNLSTNSVVDYAKEDMFYYFQRNFNHQFIDAIRQFKGQSYFQSLYTPADSKKSLAIKVGILSDRPKEEGGESPILKAIGQMFEQILNRQGLTGASFENFDDSIKLDLFRGFDLGSRVLGKHPEVKFTKENITKLSKFVYDEMSLDAEKLLDELMASDVELSIDQNTYAIAQSVTSKINPGLFSDIDTRYIEPGSLKSRTRSKGKYIVDKELMLPLMDLWFKNDYINSYFANQLISGDYAAYGKRNAIIKRMAGVKGPRIKPLIDPDVGMRATRRVLVVADTIHTAEDARNLFAELLYGVKPGETLPDDTKDLDDIMSAIPKDFAITDGQGFSSSRWIAELSRGFEAAWGVGDISKPIHAGIDQEFIGDYTTGKFTYIKYSSAHIDKNMASKFPVMKKIRDLLAKLQLDELVFQSAVKVGTPVPMDADGNLVKLPTLSELLNYSDEQLNGMSTWRTSPVMTLSNASFGFQFNAASNPMKQVSLFTQLMYFLNSYPDELSGEFGTTQEAAKEVYTLIGNLIASGRENFQKKIGNTKASLTAYLKANLSGAGSERTLRLLEEGVSIDNPLIEKKGIISLASGLEKATIKTKFRGGKLVLQSPEGIVTYQDKSLFKDVDMELANSLEYKKERVGPNHEIVVAECIVPQEMLTAEQILALRDKKPIYLMPDMLGFRLPSTEFHSAVAIRVVGVYTGKKNVNIIIVPKLMVPIQGMDFDVDALFVITPEIFTQEESSSITGESIIKYANLLKSTLEDLQAIHDNLSPELRSMSRKIRERIKEVSGLIAKNKESHSTDLNERIAGVTALLNKLSEEIPEASAKYSKLIKQYINFQTEIEAARISTGSIGAPVGYTKNEKGQYVIDTNFLSAVNKNIQDLKSISYAKEIMPSIRSTIKRELKHAISLRDKYTKNRVISIMLDVISDRKTAVRSLTAISFTPIKDAISEIKSLAPNLVANNNTLDLSHPRDKFSTYLSVATGEILIGTFANASKSYGYLTRAGSGKKSDEVYITRNTIKRALQLLDSGVLDAKVTQLDIVPLIRQALDILGARNEELEYFDKPKQTALKNLDDRLREFSKDNIESLHSTLDQRPVLSPLQAFYIEENGVAKHYNGLADIDSDNRYRVTQTFSTLTNSAVDDLNQGYLSEARINTNTGTAMIGMTALGVPLRLAIKLLYQPVLSSLSGGKINNVNTWITKIRNEYGSRMDYLADQSLSIDDDVDPFIVGNHSLQNMDVLTMLKQLTPDQLDSQLRVLNVFVKANKIGSDFRELAKFLNIIRKWDVLVEDIEQVYDSLSDNIGAVYELGDDIGIRTKSGFSFNIGNLFEGSPHIKESFKSHMLLRDTISSNFLVHSPYLNSIAETVYGQLKLIKTENKNVTLTTIRRALQTYITAGTISNDYPEEKVVKFFDKKANKEIKFVISGISAFVDSVASKLGKIKEYASIHGDNNLFLQTAVISVDKYATSRISFKTGVNLQPADENDIVTGFSDLNQYSIVDGKVVKSLPESPTDINELQRDLVKYAILTTGFQYGGTGFSSFITPAIVKQYSDEADSRLKTLVENKSMNIEGFVEHFSLNYALMNAAKLYWIPYDNIVYTEEENEDGKKSRVYAGIDSNELGTIYYDMKAKLEVNDNGKIIQPETFARRSYGNSITVYKLVSIDNEHAFYQLVGQSKKVVYSPVEFTSRFTLGKYFDPAVPSVGYHYKEKDGVSTYSQLLKELPIGSTVYIYPSYSFDRLKREEVIITGKSKSEMGGYKINYEVIEKIPTPPAKKVAKVLYNPKATKTLKDITDADLQDYYYSDWVLLNSLRGQRINTQSFKRYGDANLIKENLAYLSNTSPIHLDILADEIYENYGLSVDPSDIAEYLMTHPSLVQREKDLRQQVLEIINGEGDVLYPPMLQDETNKQYGTRLVDMGYSKEQIGEAIKQQCK